MQSINLSKADFNRFNGSLNDWIAYSLAFFAAVRYGSKEALLEAAYQTAYEIQDRCFDVCRYELDVIQPSPQPSDPEKLNQAARDLCLAIQSKRGFDSVAFRAAVEQIEILYGTI